MSFPGPYPEIGFFRSAHDNIISTITGTGADGKMRLLKEPGRFTFLNNSKTVTCGQGQRFMIALTIP
jgi:hypothetical protein